MASNSSAFSRYPSLILGGSDALRLYDDGQSGHGDATAGDSTFGNVVLVPLGNGSEEMEAVITIDVLRRAGAE